MVFSENAPAQVAQCGEQLSAGAVYKNVAALSNGTDMRSPESCDDVYGSDGWHYQCVEYVRRFYRIVKSVNTSTQAWAGKNNGNAVRYFATADLKGLTSYPNNGSARPEPDDILVWKGGKYGHVAIIKEVTSNQVSIIEQNWSDIGVRSLRLDLINGNYSIPNSGSYSVIGWLRKPVLFDNFPWDGVHSILVPFTFMSLGGPPFNLNEDISQVTVLLDLTTPQAAFVGSVMSSDDTVGEQYGATGFYYHTFRWANPPPANTGPLFIGGLGPSVAYNGNTGAWVMKITQ